MVNLSYALTKEDYINYYTYVVWDAPQNKKKRIRYYLRQLVPLLIFFLAFYYTGLLHRPGNFILLIAGFFIMTSVLSFMGVRSNMMKRGEKIANDPGNASLFLESALLASESGLQVKDELLEMKFRWAAFVKRLESKNYYFLFYNELEAVIIPKRAFKTTLEKAEFEKLLGQYLSFDAEVSHLLKEN